MATAKLSAVSTDDEAVDEYLCFVRDEVHSDKINEFIAEQLGSIARDAVIQSLSKLTVEIRTEDGVWKLDTFLGDGTFHVTEYSLDEILTDSNLNGYDAEELRELADLLLRHSDRIRAAVADGE